MLRKENGRCSSLAQEYIFDVNTTKISTMKDYWRKTVNVVDLDKGLTD